jgi:hypothetical protein
MENKIWYRSKTLWIGVSVIIIGVLQSIQTSLMDGTEISAVGLLMVVLRLLTSNAIAFNKDAK